MGIIYEENSIGVFILVTLILGGGAAALTGKAIAATWRPWWQVIAYALMLSAAVRFLHFSLFGGTLLSLHYYLVDTALCVTFGFTGFRLTRIAQMVQHYRWLYEPYGPARWRRKLG